MKKGSEAAARIQLELESTNLDFYHAPSKPAEHESRDEKRCCHPGDVWPLLGCPFNFKPSIVCLHCHKEYASAVPDSTNGFL